MLEAFHHNAWLLPVTLLSLGLVVGSFLNVVIYRLPKMMESRWRSECTEFLALDTDEEPAPALSLSTPNSHCPHCGCGIKPWQNIPVLSYLALRGKCANCTTSISIRYPLVELATGLLTLALLSKFGLSPALGAAILLTWALITLTMIDIDHQLLPDDITLPLLWLGLIFNLQGTFVSLQDAVLGAIFAYLVLWSVYWLFKLITGKEGMGYGDFKLLAALGAWLGWQAIPMIILLSSVVGTLGGVALMLIRRQGKDVPISFGPYLAIAGWVSLLWGEQIMATYLGSIGVGQ